MRAFELRSLLERGPGQLLEFVPHPRANKLAELLVAFANADGGTLLLGLDSQGRVVEEEMAEDVEPLLMRAQGQCKPPVPVEWSTIDFEGSAIAVVNVARSSEVHALTDGRVLIRSGPNNRILVEEHIRRLATTRSVGNFEERTVENATQEDFDGEVVADYAEHRRQRGRHTKKWSKEALLVDAGAIDRNGTPTVAGILLFGKYPERFLSQSGVVFVHFGNGEGSARASPSVYSRREDLHGPLPRLLEETWNVLWEEMRHETIITGLAREEKPEYPIFAVREALVNAIAHRDYRLQGRRIEVRMFDDRLEIISPGGLAGHITLENIMEEHFSRNPRIVRGLFYWGYIEELGLGIDRMYEEMLAAGLPPPAFEARPHTFIVTLYNTRQAPEAKWVQELNERQLQALAYVREHGHIASRDYQELCPHVTPETLRLDLADMVHRGILLRIGAKKGTYYILK